MPGDPEGDVFGNRDQPGGNGFGEGSVRAEGHDADDAAGDDEWVARKRPRVVGAIVFGDVDRDVIDDAVTEVRPPFFDNHPNQARKRQLVDSGGMKAGLTGFSVRLQLWMTIRFIDRPDTRAGRLSVRNERLRAILKTQSDRLWSVEGDADVRHQRGQRSTLGERSLGAQTMR